LSEDLREDFCEDLRWCEDFEGGGGEEEEEEEEGEAEAEDGEARDDVDLGEVW
jgi:hypothetical protein